VTSCLNITTTLTRAHVRAGLSALAALSTLAATCFAQEYPQHRWPPTPREQLARGPIGLFTAGADSWSSNTTFAPGDDLASPARWTCAADSQGRAITFVPHAPLAVTTSLVLALGEISLPPSGVEIRLYALDRETGTVVWSALLPSRALESQSGVTLDLARGQALVATGRVVSAIALSDGHVRWQTTLPRNVVNANVCIADERNGRARAFITDYSGFSSGAGLSCINLDAFDAAHNPREPGELLWRAPIGTSSGNTPAYLPREFGGVGLVYAASSGQFGTLPGRVWAFNASATQTPAALFAAINPISEGFYGGVSIRPPARASEPPLIAAASYAFFGGLDSANLLVVNGVSGAIISSTPSNRTQASAIISLPGIALLSTGIGGYGSVPSLQRYDGLGSASVAVAWDSATATWADGNADGLIDVGEFVPLAGWVHQPLLSLFEGRATLHLGTAQGESLSDGGAWLRRVDPAQVPGSSAFWLGSAIAQAGGSPALAGSNIYSVGSAGLSAFGPRPSELDRNNDGQRGIDDLYAWESGSTIDLDGDGIITQSDSHALRRAARWSEAPAMIGGRR
jgi:outer membrane protein assembly factor BamB